MSFTPQALAAFERAEQEHWQLVTTNYVVHETWALVQRRLGWEALEAFLDGLLPRCEIEWINEIAHHAAAAHCRETHERRFSLTDSASLETCATAESTKPSPKTNTSSEQAYVCLDPQTIDFGRTAASVSRLAPTPECRHSTLVNLAKS